MKAAMLFLAGAPCLLAACSSKPSQSASSDFVTVANVKQIMDGIVDPASDIYFGASGTVTDSSGEHQLSPANDEEWLAVEDAAYAVAESGNLLMMGDRKQDDGAWVQMAQALIDVGRRSAEAAQSRDLQRVFDMGTEMYAACTNCHQVYYIPFVDENGNVVPH
jgi:hypothetical protein